MISSRSAQYAERYGLRLEQPLGDGRDGTVFQTSMRTALKVFMHNQTYARELACYQRLDEHAVEEVCGHAVPRLIRWDDSLLAIEMEIVTAPYVLDFASAYLDEGPEFPDEVIEQLHEDGIERFGGSRWERVQLIVATLHGRYGVILHDIHPGNIAFGEGGG